MKYQKQKKYIIWLLVLSILLPWMGQTVRAETLIGREDHQIVEAPDYKRPGTPDINSDTAIVIELNSGVMLYAKNIHQRMYPASITKIITALIALEVCDLEDRLVLSHASVTDLVEGGEDARHRFYEGQSFSVLDGIYALCLNSVNTCGYALAEHIDGSLDAFSERMNQRARELGAINTTFHNPHGLNDPVHMTTAYDMAMIMWGAIQNDLYRKIAGTRNYTFTDEEGNIISCDHNYLVFQPDSDYYDSRIIAGKTGWVEEAEYTRTVYASDGNLDIICVTFHADTTQNAYEDVRVLLDYAFNNFTLVGLPALGQGGIISVNAQDEKTGEDCIIRFKANQPRSVTGAGILVPNDYAKKEWSTELIPDEGGLKAVASLDGVVLGSYQLTTSLERVVLPPPQTSPAPAESTRGSADPSSAPLESSYAASASTRSGATASPPTETRPSAASGGGWKTPLLVVMGILLALALTFCGLLLYQNKALKERVRRRKAIKKN